ncbi:protein phosphatase regulator [Vermiconidia calcicola]|uniref:Protein phosphatase regulator n=1 Tax=Vermiconidia calcicola TaxID=1690605 RepID=A0ACC3N274_9PEZI|nr:protein phosphatase regulator [Vermiconidia calcicola]
MTRPNIVRADTIDLQDQDNPSAAEHSRPQIKGGLAPHQRAEVHHVLEERDEEEQSLADAWNNTSNLTEEPDAIDQAQLEQHPEHERTANGTQHDGQTGGEGGESEAEGDDDMMDRISSSPSIDDGGYTLHSSPPPVTPTIARVRWPVRTSSLTPSPRNTPTPTRETFNQSPSSISESSPFLQTPQHLPLHVRRTGKEAFPLVEQPSMVSSPFDEVPRHLPEIKIQRSSAQFHSTSKHHHLLGKYGESPGPDHMDSPEGYADREATHEEETDGPQTSVERYDDAWRNTDMEVTDDRASDRSVLIHHVGPAKRPIESPFRQHNFKRSLTDLEDQILDHSPSFTSIASVDLHDVLLPVDDPLLDTPPSPSDSSASWESLPSDCDSWDESTNDDDTDAFFAYLDDRFIDSGWGGECLRDTEDIDFEFVYALHTFVATVEGQANATKGDTMVLLDDSNSYWWLVRVVKDNSIGYLPAEHIETPTERLARLNKHRNIDLSATMLSDNSEKSRNPLKKAMRRRNAKTVQFAAPTYVEASDYDYDTEDDDQQSLSEPYAGVTQTEETKPNADQPEEEPVAEKRNSQDEHIRTSSSSSRASFDREQAATVVGNTSVDEPQLSPKLVDKTEAAPLKSRRTRNTDSFLKDDNIETRKITLTPGLLREEGQGKNSTSTDSTRNASLENLVKQISPPEPLNKKDAKKEKKEKKGGMLSGLFKSKKKDKKSKDDLTDFSDAEKLSSEYTRGTPSLSSPSHSGRASPVTDNTGVLSPTDIRRQEVQTRAPSRGKLQKPPPANSSSPVREQQPKEQAASPFVAELQGSEAAVEMASPEPQRGVAEEQPSTASSVVAVAQEVWKEGSLAPITNMLMHDDSKTPEPTKAERSKGRVELDDFDSADEDDEPNPFKEKEERAAAAKESDEGEGLSDSPVEITHSSFMHGTESIHIPTPGPDGRPDEDEDPESLTSSPSTVEHPAEPRETREVQQDDDATPTGPRSPDTNAQQQADKGAVVPTRGLSTDSSATTSSTHLSPSTTVSQQAWSDSSLRAWLEDGSEVKDMMTMIYDKSGVVPVSDDHPLMAGLFTEQKKGVQDMMSQLDGLLGSYLQRKGIALG